MMQTYGAILVVLLIAQIGTAIAVFVMRGTIEDTMREDLENTQADYGKPGKDAVTEAWDALQETFTCCGTNGTISWTNAGIVPTPESCGSHTNGCFQDFVEFLRGSSLVMGAIGIAVGLLQICVAIIAICLGGKMEK